MHITSKNGTRTIKLDAAERRTVAKFQQLMADLVLYATHLAMTNADLTAGVYNHIDADGVFDPTEPKPAKQAKETP